MERVVVTGASGYLGRALVAELVARGHTVTAVVRPHAVRSVPPGANAFVGDALSAASMEEALLAGETLVHLVGTPKPAPWKGASFRAVDLRSVEIAVEAAQRAKLRHFIYVSVAHPAPVMRSYIAVRKRCEELICDTADAATILRPWYVLGPGHRWPLLLAPAYKILGLLPQTRATARRLGLVNVGQMIGALVSAVEHPAAGVRVLGVGEIRRFRETMNAER